MLVLGPGLGRFEGDSAWLRRVWDATAGVPPAALPRLLTPPLPLQPPPLVLDANALNMLADEVLTPHTGEMARLLSCSVAEVQRDRIDVASRYAESHGVYIVLKGAGTVIAVPSPQGAVYVNTTGNPGMARGGSGDVLAGIIGSLLAQGWDAGRAAARATAASLIAGDLIECL